jgi:hypothetical protein
LIIELHGAPLPSLRVTAPQTGADGF